MELVAQFLPDDTPDEMAEALRIGQRYLHALGITAWQDAIIRPQPEEAAYVALASRDELTARVIGAMWWSARGAPSRSTSSSSDGERRRWIATRRRASS